MVQNIDEQKKFEQYLSYLGKLHEELGVDRALLDVLGPVFVQTIRPVLQAEAQWDNEVREAWMRLFRCVL